MAWWLKGWYVINLFAGWPEYETPACRREKSSSAWCQLPFISKLWLLSNKLLQIKHKEQN
jgi:hypothetical protein